jgi:rhamnosyltransferase
MGVETELNGGPGSPDLSEVGVVIPTANAAKHWDALIGGLRKQGLPPAQVLIIDSDSTDGTRALAEQEQFQVHRIERKNFNHGGTRQLGVTLLPWARVVVFLTQDAVLVEPDAIARLIAVFADCAVGAAYGRQLPRPSAGPIEAHARLFNYPPQSELRTFESRHRLGIKAAFLSNSFSAFRVQALCSVGGFPTNVIMAEDALVAGKLLIAGWKVAYVAEATVNHSHPFGLAEEFRRYFDTGVYHSREAWLTEQFGRPAGEGKRFVISELKYLAAWNPHLIPEALIRTGLKALGYQLGLREQLLGFRLSKRLSLHRHYWVKCARQCMADSK